MRTHALRSVDAHLCYHDFPGEIPALVMIHGLGSASSSWFPPVAHHPRLRKHRSLLVDLLGFGYSDRPRNHDYSMETQVSHLCELLDALECKDCVVIGHSMGGSIAILLADLRPDLVSRLIVAEANLDPGPGFVSGRIVAVLAPSLRTEARSTAIGSTEAAYQQRSCLESGHCLILMNPPCGTMVSTFASSPVPAMT